MTFVVSCHRERINVEIKSATTGLFSLNSNQDMLRNILAMAKLSKNNCIKLRMHVIYLFRLNILCRFNVPDIVKRWFH